MSKNLNLQEAYGFCVKEGNLIHIEGVDLNKIKSRLKIIEEYVSASKELKNKNLFNVEYDASYNIIHMLVELFLIFDKIKSSNHQCLFAYLCTKHPELELDWNFFEKIRTKRNGIHYYGSTVDKNDWKEIKLQIQLYINTLQKAIENKLK